MKLAFIRSHGVIAPYVMDGFIRASQKLGYETEVLNIVDGFSMDHVKQIKDFRPDVVVGYDFNGFVKTENGFLLRQLGIPLAALHYDNPFYVLDETIGRELRNYPESYFNFIWDRYYLEIYRAKGFLNGFPILLATDPDLFYPQDIQAIPNSLAFVGNINPNPTPTLEDKAASLVDKFIDTVIDLKTKYLAIPLVDICRELMDQPVFTEIKELYFKQNELFWKIHYQIHAKGSPIYRHYILNSLEDVELHLYGTSNWQKKDVILHDKIPYGPELSKVYQQYAVNLNISSLQLESSVNNRVFDAFASKGFALSDYKQDMETIFPEHWQEVTFRNLAELGEKGEYYLTHEREKKELTEGLYHEIIKNHTYKNRVEQILKVINK